MIKTTTNDVITSTKLLMSYTSNKQKIVDGVVKTHRLTTEFVNEFKDYISLELFTTSYKLTTDLADEFPELFSEEYFLKNISQLLSSGSLGIEMLSRYVNNILELNGDTDGDDDEVSPIIPPVVEIIKQTNVDDLTPDIVTPLIGVFTESVNELLLRRTKDEDLKNTLFLLMSLDDGSKLSAASMKYLDKETKENLLGTEDVNPIEFLNTIAESSDYGWIRKLLDKVNSGEIKFKSTSKNFEKDALKIIANLPESILKDVLLLRKFMTGALTNNVFYWILENKDLSEKTLIELKDEYKAVGLYFHLRQYANKHNLEELKDELFRKY